MSVINHAGCKVVYPTCFRCDLVGPEVLPKKEMKERIREFLYSQLEEEKGLTACLIIRSGQGGYSIG